MLGIIIKDLKMKSILAFCFLLSASTFAEQFKIDTIFYEKFNLFNDSNAVAKLEIKGNNWEDSIISTFTLTYQNKTIFKYNCSKLFVDKKYFDVTDYSDYLKGTNYEECKREYYLKVYKDFISLKDNNQLRYLKKKDSWAISIIKKQIKLKSNLKEPELTQETNQFIEHLINGKYDQLYIPRSPFECKEKLVYNPRLNQFIDIDLE
jgi:hypothetical protein